MTLLDLSQFKKTFVRDTETDLREVSPLNRYPAKIPEGRFEVEVSSIYEKDGTKAKVVDKLGGSLSFSLAFKNAQKQEQLMYFIIPLVTSYKEACAFYDNRVAYPFKKTIFQLQALGINANDLRESIVHTDAKSIELLIGAQCVLENRWPQKLLHLEYDSIAKAHFFVKSDGKRFESGEMSLPISLDPTKRGDSRLSEAVAIARESNYQLAVQMETTLEVHPTANNQHINEALAKACGREVKKPVIVNKTIPAFPIQPKKPISLLDAEADIVF